MENPYASPPPAFGDQPPGMPGADGGGRRRGFIGHVRVLGILMIVQGVLDVLMGLFLVGMAVFMVIMFQNMPQAERPSSPQMSDEAMLWFVGGMYGGMGLAALIPGILNCWAGWGVFRFKQRTLGMVSLFAGLVTVMSCYCAPTSIGLMIYGLIVLLDSSVREGFALAEQGYTADQIDAMFNPWTGYQAPPPGKPEA